MNIKILQLIEGARNAVGVTVIIDVFRAFSVEAYLFGGGAREIIPVGDADLAYSLKEQNPDYLLAGERHGKILPGFDLGNSPFDVTRLDCRGKTVIHTTSAGTQGIANAKNASVILGGSLVNARATASYIASLAPSEVSLVCMGLEAKAPTEEDSLCAYYIKSLLEGKNPDISSEVEELKQTSGAKFFDKAQSEVFPTEDFFLCTKVNRFDFAMRLYDAEGGCGVMRAVGV